MQAFQDLWLRYHRLAQSTAQGYVAPPDVDDLVMDAFELILAAMRRGRGPSEHFWPYLRVVLRNRAMRVRRLDAAVVSVEPEQLAQIADTAAGPEQALEQGLVSAALATLQPRWQFALWTSIVEGVPPEELGRLLGISANAAAALTSRAREGLRQAWLCAHQQLRRSTPECERSIRLLGAYTRGRASTPQQRLVRGHLSACGSCADVHAELEHLNAQLTAFARTPRRRVTADPRRSGARPRHSALAVG